MIKFDKQNINNYLESVVTAMDMAEGEENQLCSGLKYFSVIY